MKKSLLTVVLATTLMLTPLSAQKAFVEYVEGNASIQNTSGSLRPVDFGSTVTYGETVLTGQDGTVEMVLDNGSRIRVSGNSVFSYTSTGAGTDSRPVLATTAGSVSYKLNRAAGRSPIIRTNSMVAGVRGTEFTIFAGRDGSVLLAVADGIVDVESEGVQVTLLKNEAVEVAPGEAPGAKYEYLGRELDFSDWNKQKNDAFLTDPVGTLKAVERRLAVYAAELKKLEAPYTDATDSWKTATAQYKILLEEGDKEKIKQFQQELLFPAQDARAVLILNIRYWALNYLSMRRYVVSNLYMEMKSRNPVTRTSVADEFFALHAELLRRYETVIVPELNENDY